MPEDNTAAETPKAKVQPKGDAKPEPEAKAVKPATIESGGKATVHDLAAHKGLVKEGFRQALVDGLGTKRVDYDWRHNAAAALHGWGAHEYHAGAPLELTLADYEAALKAVEEPNEKGLYVPHKGARSEYCKHAEVS